MCGVWNRQLPHFCKKPKNYKKWRCYWEWYDFIRQVQESSPQKLGLEVNWQSSFLAQAIIWKAIYNQEGWDKQRFYLQIGGLELGLLWCQYWRSLEKRYWSFLEKRTWASEIYYFWPWVRFQRGQEKGGQNESWFWRIREAHG